MATGIAPQGHINFPPATINTFIRVRRAGMTGPVSVQYAAYNTLTKDTLGAGSVPLYNAHPNYTEFSLRLGIAFTVQNLSDTVSIAVENYP